ncbi:cell division protein [Paenibacillus sambharensis]|uniref:Cell division protein n=1 Tax=Paenibacillus sambharensis TaxID=1803190 RepID=A0A2W1LD93_9BACL|nr:HNH endonuclease signature motif containing protein [Paenibacillus sambharensis]PZD93015.1 cell division protein [Paenibacillus sambharensis]
MSEGNGRPPIPEDIKREVRQRCGYGCVVCGNPLYEYDHIKEWAVVREHVAEDLTLLCDQHHKEVTNKLLPRTRIIEANKEPYNIKNKASKPYIFHYSGNNCIMDIGSNITEFNTSEELDDIKVSMIMIDGVSLLGFRIEGTNLLIHANVFDRHNQLILQIYDNELVYSISPWDIEFKGNKLTIREASRKILYSVRFDTPDRITIESANIYYNGVKLDVTKSGIKINDRIKYSGQKGKAFVHPGSAVGGIVIGYPSVSLPAILVVTDVDRYS